MTARGLVSVAAAVAMLPVIVFGIANVPQAPAAPKPQVVSARGKQSFAKAGAALAADPRNPDLIIAAARAHDVALQHDASIALYTRAIELSANDVRGYRFRGHRYISIRKFDLAIKDLERALVLAPSSFDVVYHLGLAYFLTARFPEAAKTYQSCLDRTTPGTGLPAGWRDCAALSATTDRDDESRIAVSDWLYRSLRRAGRADEAKVLLSGIPDGLAIKENLAYYEALRFYRGARTEAQILREAAFKENTGVTVGYGLANFHLAEGQTAKACGLLRRLVQDDAHWNAFGFIGAEADLTRANGPCGAAGR